MGLSKRNIRNPFVYNIGNTGDDANFFADVLNPSSLGNLELYLRSDQGIVLSGNNVIQWQDQSGNGRHLSQALTASMPTYIGFDSDFNGMPSIQFDGVADYLKTTATLSNFGSQQTVYVVSSDGTSGRLYVQDSTAGKGSNIIIFNTATSIYSTYFNVSSSHKFYNIPTTNRRIATIFNSLTGSAGAQNVYVNGIETGGYGAQAASNGDTSDGTIAIGAAQNGTSAYNGKIAAVLVFSQMHTPEQIQHVDRMLARMYQTPIISDPTDLGNCQLFLDSSRGIVLSASTVTQWQDQSGNSRHFGQTLTASRPTYNSADSDFGYQPSLTFNGTSNYLTASNISTMNEGTVYLVKKTTAFSANAILLIVGNFATSGSFASFMASATTIRNYYVNPGSTDSTRDVTIGSGAVTRYAIGGNYINGGNLFSTYVSGVATGTNSTTSSLSGTSLNGITPSIGAAANGSSPWNGKLANLIIFSKKHTASEVAQVDLWLKTKYGLT